MYPDNEAPKELQESIEMLLKQQEEMERKLNVYLQTRPARGGGGQNTWGLDWFGGPEILIKHLVIALLSRGLGARNA